MTEDRTDDLVCEEEEREKAEQALTELLQTFNKHKLRIQDIILVYGNLGYSLGASMEGIGENGTGPTVDELNKLYYSNPTIGVALMLQGTLTTSWYDDVVKGLAKDKEEVKENRDA